jgi:hypothetical protein
MKVVEEMASFFHAYCPEGVNSKDRLIVFDERKEAFIPLIEYELNTFQVWIMDIAYLYTYVQNTI